MGRRDGAGTDTGPRSGGIVSKRTSWRIWCIQLGAFVTAVACLVCLLILAYFLEAGFPCFYAEPIAYKPTNPPEVQGGMAVALRLHPHGIVGTYVITAIILAAAAVYVIVGAVTSNYSAKLDIKHRVAAAYMVIPQATLIIGNICPWLLQIAVLLFSHRVIMLATLSYAIHFVFLIYFTYHFCTRGLFARTYIRQVHSLVEVAPTHHRVVGPVRSVLINGLLFGALMATAAAAVSIQTIVAVNFTLTAPGVLICTVVLFDVILVTLLLNVEFVLSNYVHVLIGPYIGAITATGLIGMATEHYYQNASVVSEAQRPGVQPWIRVALALTAVFILGMFIARLVRAYLYHRHHHTRFYRSMKATKQRAHDVLSRRRRGKKGGMATRETYPQTEVQEPIYADLQFAGESDMDGYDTNEEPIYDEVASDPEEIVYAQIKTPQHQAPIYENIGAW
ncbi:glycoprotein M [Macropodid alphaherpesvirus 1]|uniref:Glycoprotein M n=1 Tax=Macropodid alphaherpesvirus 1 TaxID=137443 RepID=A0A0Y0A1E0_9ALPH|nr:glycoprotein M [Macropodid alphaherpesvirus 1]AMB17028.1 glycoprotein M [Macropodid alphaherpesvirus 1]